MHNIDERQQGSILAWMSKSGGYPILLDLNRRRCLVIGGGQVAARKVADLLDAGAEVILISPTLHPTLEALAERITIRSVGYRAGLVAEIQPFLVFAATNSPEVNQLVAAEGRLVGALVDSVDSSVASDFSSMAAFRRGLITVALATGSASPALAASIRQQLEDTIGPEYATLAQWLDDLRPTVTEHLASQTDRAQLWRTIVASPILNDLRQGNETEARQKLNELLTQAGL